MIMAALRLLACMALVAAIASVYISSRIMTVVPWADVDAQVYSMNQINNPRSNFTKEDFRRDQSDSYNPRNSIAQNVAANCFLYNSQEWLESLRHGNAMDESVADEYVNITILSFPEILKTFDNTRQLLKQSICVEESRFLNLTEKPSPVDDDSIRLWIIRLVYLAIHYHQHESAWQEAQLAADPICREERKARKIGPFDFECPNTKYLVVSLWDNGLGANMGHIIIPTLMAGLATNRVVLFLNKSPTQHPVMKRPWSLASCRRRDAQCFFAPMSPCVLAHGDLAKEKVYTLTKQEKNRLFQDGVLPQERDDDKVIYMLALQKFSSIALGGKVEPALRSIASLLISQLERNNPLRPILLQAVDHISKPDLPWSDYQFEGATNKIHHALQIYALRPNLMYQQQLQQILADVLPADFDAEHAIGMPVRASDKCIRESECLSFAQHVQAAMNLWEKQEQTIPRDRSPSIIFTTESRSILDEYHNLVANASLRASFPFSFVTNTHDVTPNSGRVKKRDRFTADEAMLSATSSLQLQLMSRVAIGNCCSNFHQMISNFLAEGCGAASRNTFQCLQEQDDPDLRIHCWRKGIGVEPLGNKSLNN